MLKINPAAPEELIHEIEHPFRRRRIRAIEAADAIGFVDQVSPNILDKLDDPEASVRCAAIEALAGSPSLETIKAIKRMTNDPHRHVSSAAERVISKLTDQLTSAKEEFGSEA